MMFVNDQSTVSAWKNATRDGGPQTHRVRDSDPGEGVAQRGEVPYARTRYGITSAV